MLLTIPIALKIPPIIARIYIIKWIKLCSLMVYLTVIGDNEYLKYKDFYPCLTISEVYYVIENWYALNEELAFSNTFETTFMKYSKFFIFLSCSYPSYGEKLTATSWSRNCYKIVIFFSSCPNTWKDKWFILWSKSKLFKTSYFNS